MRRIVLALLTLLAASIIPVGTAHAANVDGTYRDYEGTARNTPVIQVIIHTAETGEYAGAARSVCSYLANLPNASIHYCNDAYETIASVDESIGAWHAANRITHQRSIGIENAGYASQDYAGWHDAYSQAELERLAVLVADICSRYGIPVRKLSPSEVAAGYAGIAGHLDVTQGFGIYGGHWDPGYSFPWDEFTARVAALRGGTPVISTPSSTPSSAPTSSCASCLSVGSTGPAVVTLQKLLGITADGQFGPVTKAAVIKLQTALGVTADGVYGPATKAAHTAAIGAYTQSQTTVKTAQPVLRQGNTGAAVRTLQTKLHVTVDGVFGPVTRAAVVRFQSAHRLVADGVVGPLTWAALG